MKTQTIVTYEISHKVSGSCLKTANTWEDVLKWELDNEKEHPDWRMTQYQIKQIVTTETILK